MNRIIKLKKKNYWRFELTFFSLPILRTMSSTKPFVFIRRPNVSDSLAGIRNAIATANVARIFPAQAVDVTSATSPHALPPRIFAMSVFNPLDAKYSGRSRSETKSSILPINLSANLPPFGIVNPNMNPPKIEWIPIRSVTKPETITPIRVKQI